MRSLEGSGICCSYERSKVADALRTECFKAGECIVRQGDVGDKFYMLEEGECTVYKVYVQGQVSRGSLKVVVYGC